MANPFGAILTTAMMLAHLGMTKEAEKIEAAVLEAVRQKKTTQDIGGALGTREAGEWIAKKISLTLAIRAKRSMFREWLILSEAKDRFNLNRSYPLRPTSNANSLHFQRQSTSTNPISRSHCSCVSRSSNLFEGSSVSTV